MFHLPPTEIDILGRCFEIKPTHFLLLCDDSVAFALWVTSAH